MTELRTFLVEHPVALLFLVIGIGYFIGKIRIGSFDLGAVKPPGYVPGVERELGR